MGKISEKKLNKVIRLIYFILGVFAISLVYNAVFVPNNIVLGGVSGLAIIVKQIFGISPSTFIYISNAALIVTSYIFLGKSETLKQLLGCILYPVMVSLTAPLASLIDVSVIPTKLLLYIISALIYGLGCGIIYRAGYSTGGFDIITQILSNKLKKPITNISPILNFTVMGCGGIVFSPVQIMYAVMIIFISNKITNGVLFSISTSKMVYVISAKNKLIEDYIMNELHTGATEMKIHSGLFECKRGMIMSVVHNSQYNTFKHNVLRIDRNAFMLAKTCYQVSGGSRYELLPF